MKIYTRLTEESIYKELKMDIKVRASADKILEFISIASKFPDWIYSCEEAYIITQQSGIDIYYIRFDMIWPISDRDIVQYSVTKTDPATGVIHINTQAISGKVPEKKNVVRITENNIIWKITPLSENETRIEYYAINNPGGMVPAWLMNMVVTIGPKNTMQNLIRHLERE